jgi:hypothetical protein
MEFGRFGVLEEFCGNQGGGGGSGRRKQKSVEYRTEGEGGMFTTIEKQRHDPNFTSTCAQDDEFSLGYSIHVCMPTMCFTIYLCNNSLDLDGCRGPRMKH